MKAVIMAGGQGTRFWPLSRREHPKQFLSLGGGRTLLQQTMDRLGPLLSPADVFVVCGPSHLAGVRDGLPGLGDGQIIVEPLARNTAACIGLAALHLSQRFPGEVMAVLPADHWIRDEEGFRRLLREAEPLARQGWLVTFGIEPHHPATGYGYLQAGGSLPGLEDGPARRVARFIEKPGPQEAREMLARGGHFWNSGMFLWTAEAILSEIRSLMPELGRALDEVAASGGDPGRLREIFFPLSAVSIDYGVMEKSQRVALLPCRIGWSDVGSWRSLAEIAGRDPEGVSTTARHLNIDSRDCILHAGDGKLVALVGVHNLVVVDTGNALLVCSRERTEEVGEIPRLLEERKWDEYL